MQLISNSNVQKTQKLVLRSYQEDLVQKILSAFSKGKNKVFLELPTGAGKTIIFSHLAEQFVLKKEHVLIVAHKGELIDQAYEKFTSISGLPANKLGGQEEIDDSNWINIASIQALSKRDHAPQASLVIVDEAHHVMASSYQKLLENYPNAYFLGVSATPDRTDGQSIFNYVDTLIKGPSVQQLMDQGYLSQYGLFAAFNKVDTSAVDSEGEDYDEQQLQSAVKQSRVVGNIVNVWQERAQGKQTVVFNASIELSKQVVKEFQDAGIAADHIDSQTCKSKRKKIINQFRNKEIQVLSNCELITEGFDVPGIEVVQIIRPTKSLILWLQMIGRTLRPAEGKKYARIIDHTDNWERLGLPDQSPDCNLESELGEQDELPSPRSWQGEFSKEVIRSKSSKDLEFVDEKISECPKHVQPWSYDLFQDLERIRQNQKYKKSWLVNRLQQFRLHLYLSLESWYYIATQLEYSQEWAQSQWQLVMGVRETDDDPITSMTEVSEPLRNYVPDSPPDHLLRNLKQINQLHLQEDYSKSECAPSLASK